MGYGTYDNCEKQNAGVYNMTLLILECTPKQDRGRQNKAREGMILVRFLTLPGLECLDIKLREFQNKKDIIKFLHREKNVEGFEFVHLSGHGSVLDKHTAVFELSRGVMEAHEFPENCFWDQSVALSACTLGQTAFVDPFIKKTGPSEVIGPQREVPFTDACAFWIPYYYLVLQEDLTPKNAFVKTKNFLKGRMTGSFQYWKSIEQNKVVTGE